MKEADFPALYASADAASNRSQSNFLRAIKAEYAFLFVAAVMSLDFDKSSVYNFFYALAFIVPLGIMWCRAFLKPEQSWYKCRATAESIKTLTWRYVMRSEPFNEGDDQIDNANLRNRFKEILSDSEFVGSNLAEFKSDGEFITAEMSLIRSMSIGERFEYYKVNRIDNQRTWYSKKSIYNKRFAQGWFLAASVLYVLCILIVLSRIIFPELPFLKPDPFIVAASGIVGWMQIKRHNELSSSYALTAHEIGIMKMGYQTMDDEEELSGFVKESELAFSREHTQWVARR